MLSLKYKFERRIGLYPVGFDADGVMYCNTAFGDYPCWNSERTIAGTDRFTGWMLLSFGKKVEASSTVDDDSMTPRNITDDNIRTFWAAKSGNPGEWVKIDLDAVKEHGQTAKHGDNIKNTHHLLPSHLVETCT